MHKCRHNSCPQFPVWLVYICEHEVQLSCSKAHMQQLHQATTQVHKLGHDSGALPGNYVPNRQTLHLPMLAGRHQLVQVPASADWCKQNVSLTGGAKLLD